MGEFPSGQRGQTVNLLAMPSMVRIHLPPPKIPIVLLDGRYFSLPGRWSRSLSPSGEIHLPPPKIPIVLLDGRYFSLPAEDIGLLCEAAFQSAPPYAHRPRQAPKQDRQSPSRPLSGRVFRPPPLTAAPRRSAAAPAPGATARSPARQSSRRTPSARRAHTATNTPPPTPAAAQGTPHIAASASPLSGRKIIMHLNNIALRLYSLG